MTKDKIKIHIRNNHWKKGSLPCDLEGEKNSSVTKDLFESKLSKYPGIKDKISYLIDWDDDNWKSSMKDADILLAWNFPTKGLSKIAPKLKWIHIVSAGVNHLSPFNWVKKDLVLTNSRGIQAKKAGEEIAAFAKEKTAIALEMAKQAVQATGEHGTESSK